MYCSHLLNKCVEVQNIELSIHGEERGKGNVFLFEVLHFETTKILLC